MVKTKRIVIRNQKPLEPEMMRMALNVEENHPLWLTIHQLLQDEIDDLTMLVSSAATSLQPQMLTHTAGGLETMKNFQTRLIDLRESAMRIQENVEKKKKK